MGINSIVRAYQQGFAEGKTEALIELQKSNQNTDLPSNDTLYKIFRLVYEFEEANKCSAFMNHYEVLSNYVVKNWERNLND